MQKIFARRDPHRTAENLNLQIGEQLDFYRPPSKKDVSGWSGPAIVVDVSKSSRGVVTVTYQNQVMEAMVQDVRRHFHFWIGLAELRRPFHATRVRCEIAVLSRNTYLRVSYGSSEMCGQKTAGRAQH